MSDPPTSIRPHTGRAGGQRAGPFPRPAAPTRAGAPPPSGAPAPHAAAAGEPLAHRAGAPPRPPGSEQSAAGGQRALPPALLPHTQRWGALRRGEGGGGGCSGRCRPRSGRRSLLPHRGRCGSGGRRGREGMGALAAATPAAVRAGVCGEGGESPPAAAPASPAGARTALVPLNRPPASFAGSFLLRLARAPPARREQWSEPLTQPSPPGPEWDRPTGKVREERPLCPAAREGGSGGGNERSDWCAYLSIYPSLVSHWFLSLSSLPLHPSYLSISPAGKRRDVPTIDRLCDQLR